jgi:hypothetical protein
VNPTYPAALAQGLAAWLLGAIVLAPLLLLRAQSLFEMPSGPLQAGIYATLAWFGLVMPALIFWRTASARHHYREVLPAWKAADSRWLQLYYCHRDDVVFLAGSAQAAPPDDLSGLLAGAAELSLEAPR